MKRALILIGIPDFDYGNEQSAVRSFLMTIGAAFESAGYEVEFAGDLTPGETRNIAETPKGMKETIKSLVKKWPWFYQSLVYGSYKKRQQALFDELKQRKPFDLVVEFHAVGSTVGKQLAAHWNCAFSAIFDSPVDEQFYEMYGTKTWHWSHIKNSEKATMEAADRIMAYSDACEKHVRKYNLKPTVETAILPAVIAKKKVVNNPPEGTFNIAFIGSFLSWHKVPVLVKAFSRFVQDYPNARLQLIGYGVEWKKVNEMVGQMGLTEKIAMPGFVSEEELEQFKSECSVAVMPGSNWYGSPLKLFEYAQSGIPFIAPATPTVSYLFKANEHCLFVDPNNEEDSLEERLRFLMENPDEARAMAERGKDYVLTAYSKTAYAEKMIKALS